MINRRQLASLLGSALLMTPGAARSQQRIQPVIGMLCSATPDQWTARLKAFLDGLEEAGYVSGKNVSIEYRWAEDRNERLPDLAAELVQKPVSAIVVLGNTTSALAAKAATTNIPVIFRVAANPVSIGLVASLSRPGGNLTGVTTLGAEIGPKQFELLKEMRPGAGRFALLTNPTNPVLAEAQIRIQKSAAVAAGVDLQIVEASQEQNFTSVFDDLKRFGAEGLIISADTFFNARNARLAELALAYAMPTIAPYREFVEAGGLMSYGGSIAEASRQAGVYAGRILNGENPAGLPVQQVTKVELVVNVRTAQRLGLVVPTTLMARADEVIE